MAFLSPGLIGGQGGRAGAGEQVKEDEPAGKERDGSTMCFFTLCHIGKSNIVKTSVTRRVFFKSLMTDVKIAKNRY